MDSPRYGREDLYCGEGLARAVADSIVDVTRIIRQHLMPKSGLIAGKIIRATLSGAGDQQTADEDAVLFFDECDAMFYDRDSASRNWEIRDVNVLLQELEKFQRVCILSTNRKVTLDKALARRISLKLDFKPPTREQAKKIWEKMLPKKLPLADDVDVEELSRTSLTGGEIKNVILNAARRAADSQESIKTRKVAMADFRWALAHELKGKYFSEEHREMIGS